MTFHGVYIYIIIYFDQVTSLADFFHDDSIFIAYGQERLTADDFDLADSGEFMKGRWLCGFARS